MPSPPQIFDRNAYAARRARAAANGGTDFLTQDVAGNIAERLSAVSRRFDNALALGVRPHDFSALEPAASHWTRTALSAAELGGAPGVVADEEMLPFAGPQFDLIVSVLSLHAVNDLPGVLLQIARALEPDGLFIAAMFGGETLHELRRALAVAESEIRGGISPRVAPFADVRDLGSLLQRAGFALPVTDVERTIVNYRKFETLVKDLRGLGETNVMSQREHKTLPRDLFASAIANMQNGDGRMPVTFEIVYMTGWAPHESQQKPLAPGSARSRLADALGTRERATGDATSIPRKTD